MNPRLLLILVFAFLVGGAVYLWLQPPDSPPLTTSTPADSTPATPPLATAPESASTPKSTTSSQFLILAASWEPAFCEGAFGKPECTQMRKNRFDASNFSLHGLWPRDEYCDVSSSIEQLDRDGRWQQLPPVELSADLLKTLDQVMPGTRSQLERHEWIKHGTCYGSDAERYYATAAALLAALNASKVRDLFAASIGKQLTQAEIRTAFDDSFGTGAGQRVRIACDDDGKRRLIVELTIGLWVKPGDTPNLGKLIRAARPTDGGCDAGIVDPAGPQ